MLYLLMDAGCDTYALATSPVVEVVPCASLRSAPGVPEAVLGILNYRGQPVPVLDCGILLAGRRCPLRFSTRIVVQRLEIGGRERMVGLLAENVTRVHAFEESDFVEPGARAAEFRGTGRVASLEGRWVQRLAPESFLTAEVWETLTTEDR